MTNQVINEYRRLVMEYPALLTPRGAEGLCRWSSALLAARAGGARILHFSVKDDPKFKDHFVIFLGGGMVLDPTFPQVGGLPGAICRVSDYPRSYRPIAIHDWREDVVSMDLEDILSEFPNLLRERAARVRGDRIFNWVMAALLTITGATPFVAPLLGRLVNGV